MIALALGSNGFKFDQMYTSKPKFQDRRMHKVTVKLSAVISMNN